MAANVPPKPMPTNAIVAKACHSRLCASEKKTPALLITNEPVKSTSRAPTRWMTASARAARRQARHRERDQTESGDEWRRSEAGVCCLHEDRDHGQKCVEGDPEQKRCDIGSRDRPMPQLSQVDKWVPRSE